MVAGEYQEIALKYLSPDDWDHTIRVIQNLSTLYPLMPHEHDFYVSCIKVAWLHDVFSNTDYSMVEHMKREKDATVNLALRYITCSKSMQHKDYIQLIRTGVSDHEEAAMIAWWVKIADIQDLLVQSNDVLKPRYLTDALEILL